MVFVRHMAERGDKNMNANTNAKVAELTKLPGRVYVFVPNSKIERKFLSDAEKEGFLFENGDRPTADLGNSLYQLMRDRTLRHVTFVGPVTFGERDIETQENRHYIDYEKYISGKKDYDDVRRGSSAAG